MTGQCRLEGGPFDGDESQVRFAGDPPPKMWVTLCGHCQETHWYSGWVQGGEVYRLDEVSLDERPTRMKYVYDDADLGPSIHTEKREVVPA